MTKKTLPYSYLFLASFIIVVDQLTKYCALTYLAQGAYHVNLWLSFNLVFNRGISWGMFSSSETIPFLIITGIIAIITFIVAAIAYAGFLNGRAILGELLLVFGSVSNLIDRIVHGSVIDFIHLSYKNWSWPVFNIADMAIVLGVMLIIIKQYKSK